MTIDEELRRLETSTEEQLDSLYNFRVHTIFVYQMFEQQTQKGFKSYIRIPFTGDAKVYPQELCGYLQHYREEYLVSMVFQQTVSLFEAFFFDFLRLLLLDRPDHPASNKKIDVSSVLSVRKWDSLIEFVIDTELNELKYKKTDEWFTYLNKMIHLNCPTPDEIGQLAEVKASRNILVHNIGTVNSTYIAKSGEKARHKEGEKLTIPAEYYTETWHLIKKIVNDISDRAIQRLS